MLPLIMGGIAIAQGILGSRAQKSAAKQQAAAAQAAAARAQASAQASQAGVNEAGAGAALRVQNAAQEAGANVQRSAEAAATNSESAAAGAQQRMDDATDQANGTLRYVYDQATGTMQPYVNLGNGAVTKLSDMVNSGEFTQNFQFSQDDPGYQFRLQEGNKALERSAAARGILNSGGTLKALTRYSQGVASDEYGKAFDRFMQQRGQKFQMLSGLAGLGKSAGDSMLAAGRDYGQGVSHNLMAGAEYSGNAGMHGADTGGQFRVGGATYAGNSLQRGSEYASDTQMRTALASADLGMRGTELANGYMTDAARAQAAGTVGSANAWGNALGGVAGAAGTAYGWHKLGELQRGGMQPPTWQSMVGFPGPYR